MINLSYLWLIRAVAVWTTNQRQHQQTNNYYCGVSTSKTYCRIRRHSQYCEIRGIDTFFFWLNVFRELAYSMRSKKNSRKKMQSVDSPKVESSDLNIIEVIRKCFHFIRAIHLPCWYLLSVYCACKIGTEQSLHFDCFQNKIVDKPATILI